MKSLNAVSSVLHTHFVHTLSHPYKAMWKNVFIWKVPSLGLIIVPPCVSWKYITLDHDHFFLIHNISDTLHCPYMQRPMSQGPSVTRVNLCFEPNSCLVSQASKFFSTCGKVSAASTSSWVMPVSSTQNADSVGLCTGRQYARKWSTTCCCSVLTSTAGNSMISCLRAVTQNTVHPAKRKKPKFSIFIFSNSVIM